MSRRAAFIDTAVEAFRGRLEETLKQMSEARDAASFCASERQLHALALELTASLTQDVLQRVSKRKTRRSEALEAVRAKAAGRGLQMRNERDRVTKVRTLGGQVIEVKTPYATARPRAGPALTTRGPQGTGVYPVLDQLGIAGRSTPALRLLVSRSVAEANSVSSARDLLLSTGLKLDHKAALRLTYLVCDDALRARSRAVRATPSGVDGGEFAGRRVVVAVDGGRVNIRRRVAGRPKKGGRKRFETEWREPKVLTIYVLGEDGKRDRKVSSVLDGTFGGADEVFALMRYHLRRRGVHQAAELALVGDGAVWIWNRAASLREDLKLPEERFHEIVDYFHAVERLGDFAKSRAEWDEDYRRGWVKTQKQRLKAGDIESIEAVFRRIAERDPKPLEKELEYWARNRERLRFADFRQHGLPNGSGAVESAVRRVVNLRMKGASIAWTEEHAEGILHLRAHAKSGRWNELEDTVLTNTGWRPTARQPRTAK